MDLYTVIIVGLPIQESNIMAVISIAVGDRELRSLTLPTVAQADALRAREIRSTMEVLTTSIV